MMKRTAISMIFASAALSAVAVDVNIEGRWCVNGVSQDSIDSTCELRFYDAEGAGSPLASTNGVRFATDAKGYFVVSASVDAPSLPDTYWVGIQPSGRSEISPRFRVAPVPFALAAAEASFVKSESELTLTGVAEIEHLAVTGDVKVTDLVLPAGGTVQTKNLQLKNVRLAGLNIVKGGMLGLFWDPALAPSYDYDTFVAEKSVSAMTYLYDSLTKVRVASATSAETFQFDRDGFLMIALKAEPKACPAPRITLKVGQTTILDDRAIGTNGEFDAMAPSVKRFMTVPYRAGEDVRISVTAVGAGLQNHPTWIIGYERWTATIGAKVRLVRFGKE